MSRFRFRTALATVVIATAAAGLLVAVLTFNALPKPQLVEEVITLDHGVDDPRFRRVADVIFGQPYLEGNAIDVLENGAQIFPAKLAAIDAAEETVTLETYEYWGETIAGAFADALAAAAERGIRVHVILDYIGSTGADRSKFERMESAGVELVRWRQPSWYQLSRFNHRTHRKLLVVDGRTGFTGGANIGDDWDGTPADGAHRENHYRLRGPVVAQLQASFMKNWLRARGDLLLDEGYFPPLEQAGTLPAQVVNSFPREGHHQMRELFLYAFGAARESIRIGTAYFYPDQTILDALADAAGRGVEVDILVPGESMDKGFVRHASMNRWGPMLEAGVRVHEYEPAMYHKKLLVIDDRWVSIGSTNMDNRSFRINDETNVNVLDSSLAASLVAQMQRDLEDARRYDLERWQQRPWHHRLYGWVTMTIGAHL